MIRPRSLELAIGLSSEPIGARVLRDGELLGTTPLTLKMKRSGLPAEILLRKDGYVDADVVVFQKYYSFGHEGAAAFSAKDVAAPSHPEHQQLQVVLKDPIMQNSRVLQTFIRQFTDGPAA